jgi:fatty-acyl-CoA synthase
MLTLSTRNQYHTLLNAAVLGETDCERVAIQYLSTDAESQTITRANFQQVAVDYASALRSMGVGSGDLVIIAHTQNLESIFAFWGALLLGAIPSMFPTLTEKLDPEIYMRNLGELVTLSQVRAILTTDAFAPQIAEHISCPVYGSEALLSAVSSADKLSEFANPDPEAVAFLQHSSGTTGLQKGVALSHDAVLNQLASYAEALELNDHDVIVSWLPLYHDMGLIASFIQPLVQGIPLVLMSPFDWVRHPAMLLKAIDDYQGTLCWLPNFAYNHCAQRIRQRDSDGLDLSGMRAFINCSEPVREDSHRQFYERFAANGVTREMLTVSYAMAENTFAVTQTAIGTAPKIDVVDRVALQRGLQAVSSDLTSETAAPQVSCGRPITNSQVKIVDSAGTSLPERRVGEVLVRSDCMLTEYYRRPDLDPFDGEGWYRTGDRGYIADGEVYIVGRSKDLIINAGKNVYPQDLEAIVNEIEGVYAGRAVVFGVPDPREGTELIAVVAELDPALEIEERQIMQQIRQRISRQTDVTVNFVELVERGWLLKTSSGKIARSQNRDKWLAQREAEGNPVF